MTLGLAFWIIMLLWAVFGVWRNWPAPGLPVVGDLLLFILFLLVGWKVFGAPIHG